jgi:tryptophan-rich sensory protein
MTVSYIYTKDSTMKTKLTALAFTLVAILVATGFGYLFYNFHSQSLSALIGIICLIFIRHTYFAIHYTLKQKQ